MLHPIDLCGTSGNIDAGGKINGAHASLVDDLHSPTEVSRPLQRNLWLAVSENQVITVGGGILINAFTDILVQDDHVLFVFLGDLPLEFPVEILQLALGIDDGALT